MTVEDLRASSNPQPKTKKTIVAATTAGAAAAEDDPAAPKKKAGSSYSARRKQLAAKKAAGTNSDANEMVDITTVEESIEQQQQQQQQQTSSGVGLAEAILLSAMPPDPHVSHAPFSITRTPLSLTEPAVGDTGADQSQETDKVKRLQQELLNMKNQIARLIFGQSDDPAPAMSDDFSPISATAPSTPSKSSFSGPPPPPPPPPVGFVAPRAKQETTEEKPGNPAVAALKKGEPPVQRSTSFNLNDLEGGSRKLKKTNRL